MYAVYAFVAGLVFGIGLIVSGMYSPVKVLGFLDLAGKWDPSLAFVMAGAIAVAVVAFTIAGRRTTTLIGGPMHMPTARDIDARLVGGSLLFGIGWGLAGFCPGPALVALGTGHVKAFMFVVSMLAGMGIYEFIEHRRAAAAESRHARGGIHGADHAHAKGHQRLRRERG